MAVLVVSLILLVLTGTGRVPHPFPLVGKGRVTNLTLSGCRVREGRRFTPDALLNLHRAQAALSPLTALAPHVRWQHRREIAHRVHRTGRLELDAARRCERERAHHKVELEHEAPDVYEVHDVSFDRCEQTLHTFRCAPAHRGNRVEIHQPGEPRERG